MRGVPADVPVKSLSVFVLIGYFGGWWPPYIPELIEAGSIVGSSPYKGLYLLIFEIGPIFDGLSALSIVVSNHKFDRGVLSIGHASKF